MNLLEKQVAASLNENALNKRLVNNAYKAVVDANKFKDTSRKPQKIVYGKSSLLDKIITSNLNENAVNKRLEQISYSAIDGQRQTGTPYAPEGVQMLGQMGREKPLEAITKEMIKEYQEEEQKPFMVDGEARKYAKADYQPILQVPQSLDDIKDDMRIIYKNKVATAKTIKDADEYLKTADEYYRGLIRDINVFGMTDAKRVEKEKTERHILQERMKYDQLRNQMDKYEYELKRLIDEGKEIKRQNALIPERNREEVAKYEQSLLQSNRNRLNLQQQPYESDMDYYKRLQEIESEKVNPVLYKQYSVNKASKELKPKLENLFKDESMIEGVIKSLSENDKMIVNKNFDKIEKEFIDKYGYNPSMNRNMAVNAILEPLADTSSKIKALIQRKNAQDLYIPDLKGKQESEAQQDAFETLRGVFKRKKIEPKYARVVEKSRQIEEEKAQKRNDNLILTRSKQQAKMDELASQKKALSKISSAFSRTLKQPEMRNELKKKDALNLIKGYMKAKEPRDVYSYALENTIRPTTKLQAYMRKNQPEIQNIQQSIKDMVAEKKRIDKINADIRRVAEEEERLRQERLRQEASTNIQRVLRGHRGRQQYGKEKIDRLVQLSIDAQQMGQIEPQLSPSSATALFGMTSEEQKEAGLRKTRSDLGSKRGPYKKKEKEGLIKSQTPEEIRVMMQSPKEIQTRAQAREQRITSILQRPGSKKLQDIRRELETLEEEEEPMAKTSAPKKGKGMRKPQKRRAKVSLDEKKKDRLRD
jgi:hypothetical protein